MRALLLDTRHDRHFVGDTYLDLATATGRVTFDLDKRTCTVRHSAHPNPTSHTLRWTDEWERDDALLADMAKEAVSYLCRNCGFVLYRKD